MPGVATAAKTGSTAGYAEGSWSDIDVVKHSKSADQVELRVDVVIDLGVHLIAVEHADAIRKEIAPNPSAIG